MIQLESQKPASQKIAFRQSFSVQHQFALIVLLGTLLAACNVTTPVHPFLEPQVNPWQLVGGVVAQGGSPSLASKAGKNTLAFSADDGTSNNIYVKRWNGFAWVQLGGVLDVGLSNNAVQPSLALNSSGEPTVSWHECVQDAFGICHAFNIYLKRWNGLAWVQVGTILNINLPSFARAPSLALNNTGSPTVSWDECLTLDVNAVSCMLSTNIYVKRWDGIRWVQLGGALDVNLNNDAEASSLALDTSGNPTVSWHEVNGVSTNIYVKRWTGVSWVQLGGALDVNLNKFAYSPSLALDNTGKPAVSWQEHGAGSTNIYVKRWNGMNWVQLAGALDVNFGQNADSPSLALDSSGNPVVAWKEYESGFTNPSIYVKRWNGASWVMVGSLPLDTTSVSESYLPSLSLADGRLSMAWHEGNMNGSLYVKQHVSSLW